MEKTPRIKRKLVDSQIKGAVVRQRLIDKLGLLINMHNGQIFCQTSVSKYRPIPNNLANHI